MRVPVADCLLLWFLFGGRTGACCCNWGLFIYSPSKIWKLNHSSIVCLLDSLIGYRPWSLCIPRALPRCSRLVNTRLRAARCEEADAMSEIRVQLHSWLRLQREALPLAVRADALRRTLQACPEVRQAFFLGWLAGRVRRAAISHGQVLALELDAGQPGLLLIELQEGVGLDWLGFIHELLLALLASLPAQARGSALLGSDPQPSLLLDTQARPLQLNAAMLELLGERPLPAALELLPVNAAQLVRACLQQGRAIDGVEAQVEGQILIWLFIPDPLEQQVLARCRLATEQVQAEREAAKASRQDQLQLVQSTREALEQDGYHTMTYRIRHRAGHYLWFETANRAIRETYTGAVVEVVSVSRDITARVQAEENKRRLAEVVEANTDLVLFIDPSGRLTHLNPSARHA